MIFLKLKTFEKALISGFALTFLFNFANFQTHCETISNKFLRLHILANSDSKEDQDLKIKVRDKILEYSKGKFSSANDKSEAQLLLNSSLEDIEKVAKAEIENQGYNYDVKAKVVNMHFNTRKYDNLTLPAGNYDALRVEIGEGKGHNWWCVMFPPMCFGCCTSKQKVDTVLNSSESDIVTNENKYEIKFKCVEMYESFRSWLRKYFKA